MVKVSHHGSSDQYAGLYQDLSARVGLIGVGGENTYGHPTEMVLDILASVGTTVLRSDQLGTLTLGRNTADAIVLWSERDGVPE